MTLQLSKGAVRLGPNQTLKVVDGKGSTVSTPIACASPASRSSTRSAAAQPSRSPERNAMSTLSFERRQQLVRAARAQRNAEIWKILDRLVEALKAQPRQRESRWLAAHRGW